MPYRPTPSSTTTVLAAIDLQLKQIGGMNAGVELRDKVRHLVQVQRRFSDLGVSIAHEAGITARGAQERIRQYLIMYPGTTIDSEELQVVSGIAEFARRVRELRIEQGYQIASGASPDPETGIDLKPDQYMLVSTVPDADAARRWHIANRIRRSGEGSRSRVLAYLRENVDRVVTTEELAYVAKDAKEFARRARELRTEQGYLVATKFTGRPDLKIGQYVLESLDRIIQPHDRSIPDAIQKLVYERDSNLCRSCGWSRDRWTRSDPRILELHHIQEHAAGGANTQENLVVLCSKCHDDVHAGRIEIDRLAGNYRFSRTHSSGG